MAGKYLNRVQVIGNMTADPVVKNLPSGDPVCTFTVATNRSWKTPSGNKEEVQFHRVVAWSKLAEICGQLLKRGKRVFVEGRLSTRKWKDTTGIERESTEIVLEDVIALDNKPKEEAVETKEPVTTTTPTGSDLPF